MKFRTVNAATTVSAIVLFVMLILPQSTLGEHSSNQDIFVWTRLIIVGLIIAYALINKKMRYKKGDLLLYGCFFLIFFAKIFIRGITDFALLYMMLCLMCVNFLLEEKIDSYLIKKIINVSLVVIVIYALIYSKYTSRVAGSWLDSNMAGYFYFLLLYYYIAIKDRVRSVIVLILGMLTISRCFYLAVITMFTIRFLFRNEKLKNRFLRKLNMKILFFFALIFVLVLSSVYVSVFEMNYVTGYDNSFSRLFHFFDESNYFRCYTNLVYFKNININHFFLGFEVEQYRALQNTRVSVLPHNLMISLFVSFGIPLTVIYISYFDRIYTKSYIMKHLDFIIALILYDTFLGTSSYYGFDLLLQLIFLKVIERDNSMENVRICHV